MKRAMNAAGKSPASGDPVEDYLAAVPEPARTTLQTMRAVIRSVMPPEVFEGMSYGMPSFRDKKAGMLVAYAAFKEHCSFFPTPGAMDPFEEELKKFRSSKGTIHFAMEKPLPAALVKKIVKERLRLVAVKQAKKAAKVVKAKKR